MNSKTEVEGKLVGMAQEAFKRRISYSQGCTEKKHKG